MNLKIARSLGGCWRVLRHLLPFVMVLAAVGSGVAQEQEWGEFGFKTAGFVFEVPPGFEISENAEDAASFEGPNGALLIVFGEELAKRDFKAQIDSQMAQDRSDGWELSYIRVAPDWASYSGTKEDQIRYVRAITVCGDRVAVFVFDYPRSEKLAYDPVVERLVRTLDLEGC